MRGRLLTAAVLLSLATGWALAAAPPKVIQAKPVPGQGEPAGAAPEKAEPAKPAPAEAPAKTEAATDAGFFGELGYKDVATASDTARALVIFVSEGAQAGGDFEAGKAYLTKQGVLPDGWLDRAPANTPTTKGRLATLVCRALGIKGGLWMRLLGPLPRLALGECGYLGLMAPGCEYINVSGGELIGVIDRADRLRAKGTDRQVPEIEGHPSGAAEVEK